MPEGSLAQSQFEMRLLFTLFALSGGLLAYGVFYFFHGLRTNTAAARLSGLPYIVARKPR